jgi:predicted dehydrogenase
MPASSDVIRVAMIGCGRRAPAWVRTIRAVPQARLVALCDLVAPRVGVVKQAAGDDAIREYTDHRRLLDDGGFDAVAVVTEPEYQALLSAEALDAGYHVISEVPVCYSLDECARLVRTVERTRRTYYLAEQVRHSPVMRWWRRCVQRGDVGSVLFAEGHYLHAMSVERFWRNGKTGELLTWEQAATTPDAVKTRMWTIPHPILYGPHELSPLLKVLDDRVVGVSCLSTGSPSRRFRDVPWPGQTEEYPIADLEVAMMHTAKGAILRFAAGFQAPVSENHWYHILGTKGELETGRGRGEPGHSYRMGEPVTHKSLHNVPRTPEPWYGGHAPPPPEAAAYLQETLSEAARATGHGGYDYYPLANFIGTLLGREKPDIDVYQAVETAAPVIVAAQSAERGGAMLPVPDFRPAAR